MSCARPEAFLPGAYIQAVCYRGTAVRPQRTRLHLSVKVSARREVYRS